jgi:hypothetical protein
VSVLTLSPVSAGVYTALNVAGLTALVPRISDTEVRQNTGFPCCWFVLDVDDARGFGRGVLAKISLRVHAASTGSATQGAAKEVQAILSVVEGLLKDRTLTIAGYRQAGEIVPGPTSEPFASEVGGVACWEALSNFTLWVEP